MKGNKHVVLWILLVGVLLAGCRETAPPRSILFIGDSFTNRYGGIDKHVVGLAATNDPPMVLESAIVSVGGTPLSGLWIGRAVTTIQEDDWDVVVLQEDLSMDSYSQEKFFEYTRKFYEEIKDNGGETVLYMPWEWDNGSTMTIEEIAADYKTIGDELGVKVAPVGLAWANAIAERPDLELYIGDRVHQSMSGNYLTIAVLYATIFEQSPEGLPYMPTDLFTTNVVSEDYYLYMEWEMSEEDIAFLQRIAWETVADYLGFE